MYGYGELMLAVLVPAALLASSNDWRFQRIPNWLTGTVAVGGLAAQWAYSGLPGLLNGVLGLLVGFGLLVTLWCMHAMGAGDVKFMAAIGAWLGPKLTLYSVLAGGIAGGVMALVIILLRRKWSNSSFNFGLLLMKFSSVRNAFSEFGAVKHSGGTVLPYAIPLSVGTLFVVVSNYTGWWEVL